MSATPAATAQPSDLVWDLSTILPATQGPQFDAILAQLEAKVRTIEAYKPKLDALARPEELVAIVDAMADIRETASRLDSYGHLMFSVDTTDAKIMAYMGKIDQLTTDAANRIRFFELWWKQLPEARAAQLVPKNNPDVAHWLLRRRVFSKHTLSDKEERVIAFKDLTGGVALDRLREILTSQYRFTDPKTGQLVTQSELSKRVHDPDAATREAAYQELWRVYAGHESELAYLYQSVVTDWGNETLKLRGYPTPISVRNLENDVPDEAVAALLGVCHENRALFHRYFMWKGQRLELPQMSRFHLYAPLRAQSMQIPYEQARSRVLDAFDAFSPEVGAQARKVFDERHVHVMPAANKRGGAYCATVNAAMTPYVFLNYTGDASSVKTLAHEMGHAIHSLAASKRHPLVAHAGLPLCETASVFAEMLLHDALMQEADAPTRTAILSDKLAEVYATVMRQAYFVRFEIEAHDRIPQGATTDDLHALYLKDLQDQLGPVHVPEEFRREWTYIPHIYASPFYCYAYSFGMLLSLALYQRYREVGASFVPKYLDILAAGGAVSPEPLLKDVGVDIRSRAFWQKGFDVIGEMVADLEKSA